MSLDLCQYAYIGRGEIWVRNITQNLQPRYIGNANNLGFSVETDEQSLPDYSQGGGGSCEKLTRITKVSVQFDMFNQNTDNIALGFRGVTANIAASAIPAEPHTGHDATNGCVLVQTNLLPDPSAALTVTGPTGAPVFTEGTDFRRSSSGIIALDTGAIGATDLEITYTAAAQSSMEALVAGSDDYELIFEGLNEAKSNRPVSVNAFRVKFDPAADWSLINDEYSPLSITGEVLLDPSKTGALISKYFVYRSLLVS